LTVTVHTADVTYGGTNDDVYFGMRLKGSLEWLERKLDNANYNNFTVNSNQDYYLYIDRNDFPPSDIAEIRLRKEGSDDWKVYRVIVSIDGVKMYDEIIDSWLSSDNDEWHKFTEAPKSSAKEITAFNIGSSQGIINENELAITVTVPYGTDVTSLVPSITVSDKATVSPDSGTHQDFTNPVSYTVTAEDGSQQVYVVMVNTAPKITNMNCRIAPGVNEPLILNDDGRLWIPFITIGGTIYNTYTTKDGEFRRFPFFVLDDVISVSSSVLFDYNVALMKNGTVYEWYMKFDGISGNTLINFQLELQQIMGLSDITAISAGGQHALALRSDGTVWAWGLNGPGALGDDTTDYRSVPVQVRDPNDPSGYLHNVTAIAAGKWDYFSLALKSDGTVWAWGSNYYGELNGTHDMEAHPCPVQVPNLQNIVAISAGDTHCLALKKDGTVWAWGYNSFGELGVNASGPFSPPVLVPNLNDVIAVSAGYSTSFALRKSGTVLAWGYNAHGELGDGTTEHQIFPVPDYPWYSVRKAMLK
jgi:hypothetical protein